MKLWTIGLIVGVAALGAATASLRRAEPESPAARPARPVPSPLEAEEPPVAEAPELPPAASASLRSRSVAWTDGYREAREAAWEGSLNGQVLTLEGPLAGGVVKVEWVLAFRPEPAEALRLKRGGARRDRDGVWWSKTLTMTDEGGFFSLDGLPAVQLKVSAGRHVQRATPGQTVLLRTGIP